jgi:hypothetical protein
MNRDIVWSTWDGSGLEHLRLNDASEGGFVADSAGIAIMDGSPYRVRYRTRIDSAWRTRSVWVDVEDPDGTRRTVALIGDGEGNWTDTAGEPRLDLEGCVDIDIRVTPFTNSLPIRRLGIQEGQVEPISVVYIDIPSLVVTPEVQRYTGLADNTFRFEGISTGFIADLVTDSEGFITTYPDGWRLAWTTG